MDSHGKVARQSTNSDRFSNLPEEVIQSILGRLPIEDAVKTGILSRNWRHKWTSLPHLVFDVPTFSPRLQDEGKLVEAISRILFHHKGPISKFSLSVKTMTSYSMIDQWLQYLSNNGAAAEFILEFLDGSGYKIHSSLFSCPNFRHLKLRKCIIPSPPPTTFNGFNNLTFLELECVTFNNKGFENLIAKCPQLGRLDLCLVHGLDRLNIHHAPKLQALNFRGNLIKQISLKYAPSLLYVRLACSKPPDMNQNLGNNGESILINHLKYLSDIREFVLGHYFLKFLAQDSVRTRLPSIFNYLWHIQLCRLKFDDMDSVHSALGLITSSPNLLELVVTAFTKSSSASELKTVTEYLEGRSESIGSLMKLRYVNMNYIKGLGPEMQFIKMILGNSPLLKQMRIQHSHMVTACWATESKILKELIRFPRVSTVAEIVY